jgi:hypothetical protein
MILIRMCTDVTNWVDAGAALGFPADKSRNWTRYAFADRWTLKPDLLTVARQIGRQVAHFGGHGTYRKRPAVQGFGGAAVAEAQSPLCRDDGGDCARAVHRKPKCRQGLAQGGFRLEHVVPVVNAWGDGLDTTNSRSLHKVRRQGREVLV